MDDTLITKMPLLSINGESDSKENSDDDNIDIEAAEKLLDSLYGNEWRKKQFEVLPKSTPRYKSNSKKLNPFLDSKLTKVQCLSEDVRRIKNEHKTTERPIPRSPWQEQLKHLCDSESSDDDDENVPNYRGLKNLKQKLNFDKKDQNVNLKSKEIESSDDEDYDNNVTRIYEEKRKSIIVNPSKQEYCSFLESLSLHIPLQKCDLSARVYRINYQKLKHELAKKLFDLYNEKVFNGAISNDTKIEWNLRLRTTAGKCICKRITKFGVIKKEVTIELATKILDTADRLRDTLIHEMCHAATFIVDNVSSGHGSHWKNWAFKAMSVLPGIPPIQRTHNYTIEMKYTYRCVICGYCIRRHSKSINLNNKRCGYCRGKFELLVNF